MSLQAEFEKYAKSVHYILDKNADGTYVKVPVQCAWEAWQAKAHADALAMETTPLNADDRRVVFEITEATKKLVSDASRTNQLERELAAAKKVAEAAKWANFCPDAGGYMGGRSVEDCYEQLDAAVQEWLGITVDAQDLIQRRYDLPNGRRGWLSEADLDAAIAAQPTEPK